jgi:HAD superfamily hydrolase (TIGR01509 family)
MMKNIVFDLAGVVFARNEARCPQELMDYFYFINSGEQLPDFWCDYDRGTRSFDNVAQCLAQFRGSDVQTARHMMATAITYQDQVAPTAELIAELKGESYRLFVLSNMSKEYIDFLRKMPVYQYFDGEVISCEVGLNKPEREIYSLLLDKFSLDPLQTMFIDDRKENVVAAAELGIVPFHFDRNNPEQSCNQIRELLKK